VEKLGNKMLRYTLTAVLALAAAAPASAATVLAYDTVNGPSVAASVEHYGVTGYDLARGSGVTQNAGSDFNSRGWTGSSILVLPRFSSGLFRAMFAMKEIKNGNEIHRRVSA
jgi:hypothetical protein